MSIFTDDNETSATLEAGGNVLPDEMPFKLLLFGDWSGRNSLPYSTGKNLRERHPVFIDRDNFEDVMRKLDVSLSFDLQEGGEPLQLRFEELDDFHPDKIFHQVSLFADLRDTRKRLMNPQTFNSAAKDVREWLGGEEAKPEELPKEDLLSEIADNFEPQKDSGSDDLLGQILSQSNKAPEERKPVQTAAARELSSLLGELVRPFLVHTDEAEQAKLVSAVDQASGELMRKILHHPQFQALESAWRGAYMVVSQTETDSNLKIYLFDATKDELADDLKSAGNLTESAFYKLLSEKTRGSYVDESWAAVCADYVFNPDVDDTAALMRIAQIAADSETPFIAAASPKIFGIESLAETPDSRDWQISENTSEGKLWAMLRAMPEAEYVGLALPRMLIRMPYGAKSDPTENFSFEELNEFAPEHEFYLWANPAFACALLLAQSFSANGWEMDQRFSQDVENLPLHMYKINGETKSKPCAETEMTQSAAERILEEGFMPLISYRDHDLVKLGRFQSIASSEKGLQGKWS